MRWLLVLVALPLGLFASAGEKPDTVSVRLHAEGVESETATFVTPVTLYNPPKETFIRRIPIVTERDFEAFFPFVAPDGTIGAYFKLDADGTHKLTQFTVESQGRLAIALINGRVAGAMLVDKRITDGILHIPSGFTALEVAQLQAKFPTIGKEREFAEQKVLAREAIRKAKASQPKSTPTPKPKPTPRPKNAVPAPMPAAPPTAGFFPAASPAPSPGR